ncbi:MAG: glycosyltransferase family 4 protein [Marinicaulis sp.]|nr:glycosyltransferase family 4 protein [Marinicaulis sp.]
MNLAYLMNTFPLTSTTFIRREIDAIERAGQPVKRYALRHWGGELIEPADIEDQKRTHYILSGNAVGLVTAFFKELAVNPDGIARAIGPWWSLLRAARGGIVRHFAYFLEAIYFKQQCKRDAIDHVHVHFLTNSTAVAMLARIMGGAPYSAMAHGPDELTDAPLLDFPAKIEHAEFITAITHYCKSQLIRFSKIAYAEKIKIIHCALDMRDFEPNHTFSEDNQVFVCVGRLCPQKGQVQLPAAVAELRGEFPNMKVLLVGDGESRADLEAEIAAHDVGDIIEIKGWMANADVREFVRECRTFLLPSYAEGLPVVIMEAYALGRPVISTYIAGIPELVDGKSGWIIPAGNHDALVDAMRAALAATPAKLEMLGREGRARVEDRHDVDKEAAALLELISAAKL